MFDIPPLATPLAEVYYDVKNENTFVYFTGLISQKCRFYFAEIILEITCNLMYIKESIYFQHSNFKKTRFNTKCVLSNENNALFS